MSETNSSTRTGRDILIEGPVHKLLVFLNHPADWPVWKVAVGAAGLVLASSLLWRWTSGSLWPALLAGLLLGLFVLADGLLLRQLPRLRLSFGPWQPQLFALGLPRWLASLALALLTLWLGVTWGIVGLFAVQLLGSILLLYGAFIEPFRLSVTDLTVATDRMPPGSRPLRLLHITDLHVERLTRREEHLLQLIAKNEPDLIVITGDYLNLSYVEDEQAQAEVRSLLARLSAPLGVYATLGSPTVDNRQLLPELLAGLPLHLLRDEWCSITTDDGQVLNLLGLDCTHDLTSDGPCLEALMAAAPDSGPRLLLYHSPELMDHAARQPLDLYLCGHTHGGQVRLPLFGPIMTSSQLGRRYVMGHYYEQGTHLYVSRGVGLEGLSAPRVRFLAPPEVVLVTIQSG